MLSDNEKMAQLIVSLYELTDVRANVLDAEGRDLYISNEGTEFCRMIQSTPEGLEKCRECDRKALADCGDGEKVMFYRCHAGLCEAVKPLRAEGRVMGYLLFGEYLDTTSRLRQWESTLRGLDWYQGDREELRRAFDKLHQYTPQKIKAYLEVVQALKTYIYMSGMMLPPQYTDAQRLERYLDQHYMEKLSLTSLSEELNMGRTKLCALARSMPGGYTISQLITRRRVRAACRLLRRTDLPISEVSEAVGVSDYNYFSKIFRQAVGVTPREYRGLPEAEADRRAEEIQ